MNGWQVVIAGPMFAMSALLWLAARLEELDR